MGPRRITPPRMIDIAERVGVSVATVSRALMGSELVNAETRARIAAAAEAMGYRLNHVARSLRTQRTSTVLVIVPDIGNPFFSYVLEGVEAEAEARGYAVLLGNVGGQPAREVRYASMLRAGMADGVVLLTGRLPDPAWAEARPVPVVAIYERLLELTVPTARIDDVAAAAAATRHLLELGHRRIGHIAAPAERVLRADRLAGFRRALAAAGLDADAAPVEDGDLTIASGAAAFRRLRARAPDLTALVAANDEMAIGAINAARELGLEAGRDISVIGFDGLEIGQAFHPPLTSIHQPRVELGKRAMAMLDEAIAGPPSPPRDDILPWTLVLGATTGSPMLVGESSKARRLLRRHYGRGA